MRDNRHVAALRTPLCLELGIEYPILSAGIGQAAGPELVSAVSNAGGFGVLGLSGTQPAEMRRLIGRTRELTERPFGGNIIIDEEGWATTEEDKQLLRDEVATAADEGLAAIVLFWGNPVPYVEVAHSKGVKILIQVGSVEEAEAAAEAGVDAVIAQGVEAGGHVKGTTSIWELIPVTVEAIDPVPVLASGGIGDGAGIARVLRLGAQAVSLGTRFIASDEAWLHPAYKQRIVEARAEDTVLNELYDLWWTGAPGRTLRNKTLEEWEAAGCPPPGQRPGEGTSIGKLTTSTGELVDWPRYAGAGTPKPDFVGDIEYAPLWAGESVSAVNDILPAGEIVRRLARDAETALAEAQQLT
jgi:NAD(P)H-dependent flavin oxidoreductase YrpB (nitropropane dioxygenase family)